MKKINLLIIILGTSILSIGQNIPNGGFENWDTTYIPENPSNWMFLIINTDCVPVNLAAERTEDAYSDDYAVILESKVCVNDLGGQRLEQGRLFTGNAGTWPPKGWSIEYSERPEFLNFYYKFHQEGNDSAYVRIMLFNYDSITPGLSSIERVDTIAFSSGYVNDEVDEYTQFQLPINYFSEEVHTFVHILFSTSKTLSEGYYGNTPPYQYAYPGTILTIDDVSVLGGTVGIDEIGHETSKIKVYPNPTSTYFRIETNDDVIIKVVSILDYLGRSMNSWDALQEEFNIQNYQSGIYYIHIVTSEGVIVKKLIKKSS